MSDQITVETPPQSPSETDPENRIASRIQGFDIARALAIFGMITVNYRATFPISEESPAWFEWAANQVNGRAAALFVFLAGIGISLLSRKARFSGDKADIRADRVALLRRSAFLLVIGFWFRQYWEYDILHFYGVYLLIAAAILTVPNRGLLIFAFVATIVFPFMFYILPEHFGIDFWGTTSEFNPRAILIDYFFQGYHPVLPWIAFMIIGMIIGRLDLTDKAIRRRLLIGGVVLALTAETIGYIFLNMGVLKLWEDIFPSTDLEQASYLLDSSAFPPMPLFIAAGLGWGMAIVSLCLSLGERFAGRAWIMPLVHTGQLALTIYIVHGTIGVWVVEWVGHKPSQTLTWVIAYSALLYAVLIVLATLWRRRYERGPVEAIMRRLTDSWKSEINPVPPADAAKPV
ncbi:MAG: DUF1624 domain-containing protein [Sphingomonadaceae bacterium]|nr:DUF1624 domain-containing protein [Sphingomonadaceae bacterium]